MMPEAETARMNEPAKYNKDDLERIGAKWMDRIDRAYKREESWFKDALAAEAAYLADEECEHGEVPEFNILHSNVETIVPSIYNSTPVPDIRPRHPTAAQPQQPQQQQAMPPGQPGMPQAMPAPPQVDPLKLVSQVYERAIQAQIDDNRLDKEIEREAQDAFLAGRGVIRIRFDADDDGMGGVTNERLGFEVQPWGDYRQGAARRWADVPWVAYRHYINEDDAKAIENDEYADIYADSGEAKDGRHAGDMVVWEIWCKSTGNVYFIEEDTNKVLDIKPDPMGLQGFFPQPEPVQPITATKNLTPVCPFRIYRALAEELDRQTVRINAIMRGLKVRGAIAANAEAVELIAGADDNELVPVGDLEGLVATGGLEKAIMWWPVDKAIQVLQQLYVQREQTKQAIYEITGISDIIRGQGSASETATAQQIKTEWGSMRIKKMQRAIERNVRDIFVLCAEIIAGKFSVETLQKMTGIMIPPEAMAFFQQPLDHYLINVESDSTIQADVGRNRREMGEFLNGTAQYFATMAPVVQQAPETAGEIVEIFSAFARQYRLGKQAEDALDRLVELSKQAAQKPPADPNAAAAEAEMQAKQMEMQAKAGELQMKAQEGQARLQFEGQKAQAEMQIKASEAQMKAQADAEKLAFEREKLAFEREKFAADVQMRQMDHDMGRQKLRMDYNAKVKGAFDPEEGETGDTDVVEEVIGNALAPVLEAMQMQTVAIMQAIQQSNAAMASAMVAPKELIRDEAGRLVGVKPMGAPDRMVN